MSDNQPAAPEQTSAITRIVRAIVIGARRFNEWATPIGTASAFATLVVLIATLLGETTAELIEAYRNFTALVEPWWTRAVLFVPLPLWWLLTVAFAIVLWLYCRRLATDHGAFWFFVPPVLLYILPLVVGWALYTPIRAA